MYISAPDVPKFFSMQLSQHLIPLLVSLVVLFFLGMLIAYELGRRLGTRARELNPGASSGFGPIESATLALLGLMIAFSFSGAASRFEDRRQLIAQEANSTSTVWLRLDVLSESDQPRVRQAVRSYLDSRLAFYAALPDLDAAEPHLQEAQRLQSEIWHLAVVSLRSSAQDGAREILLPALNDMFDIATLRMMALSAHPSLVIYLVLVLLAVISAVLAGHASADSATRRWLPPLIFAGVTTVVIYVTLDLEFPRVGLIRVDDSDEFLRQLRASM